MTNPINEMESNKASCDSSLSRTEFLKKVAKGVAITGGALASPAILDKFLVPAAYAQTSICSLTLTTSGDAQTMTPGPDTVYSQPTPSDAYEISCVNGVGGDQFNQSVCLGAVDNNNQQCATS